MNGGRHRGFGQFTALGTKRRMPSGGEGEVTALGVQRELQEPWAKGTSCLCSTRVRAYIRTLTLTLKFTLTLVLHCYTATLRHYNTTALQHHKATSLQRYNAATLQHCNTTTHHVSCPVPSRPVLSHPILPHRRRVEPIRIPSHPIPSHPIPSGPTAGESHAAARQHGSAAAQQRGSAAARQGGSVAARQRVAPLSGRCAPPTRNGTGARRAAPTRAALIERRPGSWQETKTRNREGLRLRLAARRLYQVVPSKQ